MEVILGIISDVMNIMFGIPESSNDLVIGALRQVWEFFANLGDMASVFIDLIGSASSAL
ncbi:MAG: hypothetical protein LBB50_05060 [Oscillospiraceae bacterium]|nr:hypothetical protein [Oscillospiraceae bacterium]